MIYQDIIVVNEAKFITNQRFRLASEANDIGKQNLFLPDGLISIIFLQRGSFQIITKTQKYFYKAPEVLIAFFTEPQLVYFDGNTVVHGQTLYPWTSNLLGMPCIEFKDKLTTINSIYPLQYDKLLNDLQNLKVDTEIPDLILNTLFSKHKLTISAPIETFLKNTVEAKGQLRITDCLPDLSISTRKFQNSFLEAFGITAKFYCDLCKFNYSKVLLEKMNHLSLAAIAQYAGYYDQSHFIRTFKKFSNSLPKVLRKQDIGMGKYFSMYRKAD